MAANLILPFAPTDTGTNLLSQPQYNADGQRITGNQPGIARLELVNKALRQATIMAAGLAQVAATAQATDVSDDLTVAQMADVLRAAIVAVSNSGRSTVGLFANFPTTTAPLGWLKRNGAAVSRTTYAALFAQIGTTFGAGDGVNTFNLPDSRGDFDRNLDEGAGVDPGRTMGSLQTSQNLSHSHTAIIYSAGSHTHGIATGVSDSGPYAESNGNPNGGTIVTDPSGDHTHTFTIDNSGGAEVRVRNRAWPAYISYL